MFLITGVDDRLSQRFLNSLSEERNGPHWRPSRRSKSEGPARCVITGDGERERERRRESDPDVENLVKNPTKQRNVCFNQTPFTRGSFHFVTLSFDPTGLHFFSPQWLKSTAANLQLRSKLCFVI
ncbi:hypothetical protein NQ317_019216 [Molorchus minor]|uniref:Uncharacterized protein n=1 Tax=Molorchus minor TaxID=1323400 RepID=A0ABQ9JR25_9CUCU|nr:hypothetical protein NQ317_019216 [Molorchus minor]